MRKWLRVQWFRFLPQDREHAVQGQDRVPERVVRALPGQQVQLNGAKENAHQLYRLRVGRHLEPRRLSAHHRLGSCGAHLHRGQSYLHRLHRSSGLFGDNTNLSRVGVRLGQVRDHRRAEGLTLLRGLLYHDPGREVRAVPRG
jgi:hypothetical protein